MRRYVKGLRAIAIALAFNAAWSAPGLAWGDEGHQVVALIAQRFLDPVARAKVAALLAADPDTLTRPTIQDAATWADRYRDHNQNNARLATRQWHFVDIEIAGPDLDRACFGHPPVVPGRPASQGPAQACVVDKIKEFTAELANPATDPAERIIALKFLLHFVGDVHQPLHASDDNDHGGNKKRASAPGIAAGTLHHYWDTEFVDRLGPDPDRIASALATRVSQRDSQAWSQGGPVEWARESFRIAKDDGYGRLPPPNARGGYRLTDDYVAMATRDVSLQLSKAGVRLAVLLNRILGQGTGGQGAGR